MNKLRRDPARMRPSFPKVDTKTQHVKGPSGELAGNMMGYPNSNSHPATQHTAGNSMPGNMMGYSKSKTPVTYPDISNESQNYGPSKLSEPTRSGFDGKTIPPQMKDYQPPNAENAEWTRIQSAPKKKGSFYGKK